MIAIGDGLGVESRASGGLLPSFFVETPPISSMACPSALSPAATVCGDVDVTSETAPEFKLSQCFGDCSPAEEATQGEPGGRGNGYRSTTLVQVCNGYVNLLGR